MKKILIIDDDPVSVRLIEKGLRQNGYDIVQATSGEEGVDLAIRQRPLAIIADVMMPDINGLEVVQLLQANQYTKNIPVVLLRPVCLWKKIKDLKR